MARLAESLEVLRSEIDARAPMRNKASDGWIGNADHQAMASDHNPNADDVVCALDITNDPDNGCDVAAMADFWRQHPHPDVKYVILHTEGRMWSAYAAHGVAPFTWRPYGGGAAAECHVSVGVGRDGQSVEPYDDRDSWFDLYRAGGSPGDTSTPAPSPAPSTGGSFTMQIDFEYQQRDDNQRDADQRVKNTQALVNAHGAGLNVDGFFGPATDQAVRDFQSSAGIGVDGIVGPVTLAALLR